MRPRTTAPRATLLVAFLVLALAPVPGVARAKQSPANRPVILTLRPPEATVARGTARIGVESGVPRVLYDLRHPVAGDTPEAMARAYLRDDHRRLRLADATLGDLAHRATRLGPAGATVRFEQRIQGIPVLGPDLAVTLDRRSRVTFVANGYQPGLSVPSTAPAVDAAAARASALAWLAVEGTLAHEATRLVVVPGAPQGRLAWQVRMVPAVSPTGDWEVLVDAGTGQVFGVTDRALYVNGSGQIFDPDPLAAAHATYGAAGYSDANDAATAQLDAARSTRTLPDLTDLGGGTIKLQSPYAAIVDVESPFKGIFTQAGTTFDFTRAQDAFEAVNTFFHVDQIMRHVNLTLGQAAMPFQYAGGVRFDPSGLNGADNSHYLPSSGVLSFGEGGVDDAEDADVVIHELGHGLHDWLTAGEISQVNGLSEGLGDYVAQSYSRSLGQWASNEAPYHWVFGWDGHNEFWAGRTTNYGALYPGGLVNQIHTDGQIWSSCLMKIWNDVGRNKTDAAVLAGIAMTNSASSQDDAAQAVLQAAIALGHTAPEIQAFATHFQNTGYSVSIDLDYRANSVADDCASDPTQENGVMEPGETVDVAVSLGAASLGHTGVTGTLATTTPGVTIVEDTATWPAIAAGGQATTDAPHFRVAVDAGVACYTTVDFQLTVASDQGGPYPMAFSRRVGQPPAPGGLPVAIPDNVNAGVTSTLIAGADVTLSDVDVRVEIDHAWVGDLHIKLRSPAGTEVVLLDRPGVPGPGGGCGNDDLNVTFDDAAALVLESHCAGTTPWYAGDAKPAELLSAFNGQSSLGNWVLTVSDRAGQIVGTLVDWELITTPPIPGVCDPCPAVAGIGPGASREPRVDLGPSRPNPFSRSTEIAFHLARPGPVSLHVYDVSGQVVATLVAGELAAGPHTATWDGRDRSGRAVASGVYFYGLSSEAGRGVRRMLLIR